jgi:hypothetical protein
MAGLNLGGCTVFAAIVSSASYIAACTAWVTDVGVVRGARYVRELKAGLAN